MGDPPMMIPFLPSINQGMVYTLDMSQQQSLPQQQSLQPQSLPQQMSQNHSQALPGQPQSQTPNQMLAQMLNQLLDQAHFQHQYQYLQGQYQQYVPQQFNSQLYPPQQYIPQQYPPHYVPYSQPNAQPASQAPLSKQTRVFHMELNPNQVIRQILLLQVMVKLLDFLILSLLTFQFHPFLKSLVGQVFNITTKNQIKENQSLLNIKMI